MHGFQIVGRAMLERSRRIEGLLCDDVRTFEIGKYRFEKHDTWFSSTYRCIDRPAGIGVSIELENKPLGLVSVNKYVFAVEHDFGIKTLNFTKRLEHLKLDDPISKIATVESIDQAINKFRNKYHIAVGRARLENLTSANAVRGDGLASAQINKDF
jgi:hypothetical protein